MTEQKTILQLWLKQSGMEREELTTAELMLLSVDVSWGSVDPIESSQEDDRKSDFENNDSWTDDRIVRAFLINWILSNHSLNLHAFLRRLDFYNVRIIGEVQFVRLSIPILLSFKYCVVEEAFFGLNTKFDTLWFRNCILHSLSLPNCHFTKDLELENCVISKYGEKQLEHFSINLPDVILEGSLKIGIISINKGIDLLNAEIGSELNISSLMLNSDDANNDKRLTLLRFQSVRVGKRFFLGQFMSIGVWNLDLKGCNCDVFLMDKSSWPQKDFLWLDQFKYSSIQMYGHGKWTVFDYLDWLHLQKRSTFSPQPWQQLAKTYMEHGDAQGAAIISIEKERSRRKCAKLNKLQKAWSYFLDVFIGYGYRNIRAVGWMIVVMVLGWAVFWTGFKYGKLRTTDVVANNQTGIVLKSEFNSFVYAFDLFVPFLDLNQDKYWVPATTETVRIGNEDTQQKISYSWFYRGFYWVYICLGWLFSTLLAASWTGILKKD